MLRVEYGASVAGYNTFGIDCRVRCLAVVEGEEDLDELAGREDLSGDDVLVVGKGSNVVFGKRFEGVVVVMESKGERVEREDESSVWIRVAAGEVWDEFVKRCVGRGMYGVENLVAIPGTVGASAVQNIGAYGVEAKNVIESVEVWDRMGGERRRLTNEECGFGYRNSVFKSEWGKRWVVTAVTYRLEKEYRPILTYAPLVSAMENEKDRSARRVSEKIEEIRWSKLPKPEEMGSAGSFFKNPVVGEERYEELRGKYPTMVGHRVEGGWKLSAGWLIDNCGWKGRREGRCRVYEKQALVIVNCGGCDGVEVRRLAGKVMEDVWAKYGVRLEPEAVYAGVFEE